VIDFIKRCLEDGDLRLELRLLRKQLVAPIHFSRPWPFVLLDIILLLVILSLILWMIFTQASTLNSIGTANPELKYIVVLAMAKSTISSLMVRIIPREAVSKEEGGTL